ncbi:NADP-dependent oxidoreductase domain-containing protein [Mycena filopes]|nr:NADP-dependent oxidoreductase domain-containing protein [Mycena filopes]
MTLNAHGLETFDLGPHKGVPRLWCGLWQLSSNAWGSAPVPRIRRSMAEQVEQGFTAFADHYGSAEIIFGQFRNSLPNPEKVLGATKWCVFKTIDPTRAVVEAAVRERMERMGTEAVDLLQFHWQDYASKDYLTALAHLVALRTEGIVKAIGLCNFDTIRTDEICTTLGRGVVVSNQVQFSLIDTRPLHGMTDVCARHGVKLLTYGTLCGGFLSDAWLGAAEPDLYAGRLTPSQRKYLDMILKAWGTWALFQRLLRVLRAVADRHVIPSTNSTPSGVESNGVSGEVGGNGEGQEGGQEHKMSIANVATRWVLDQPCVGAVLVGTRLALSSHLPDNARVFHPSFALTDADRADIEAVLDLSEGRRIIVSVGDCGSEYR